MKSQFRNWTIAAILAVLAGVIAFYKWDSSANRGLSFGYYGELNTVKEAASSLPNVEAVRVAAANIDIGLEEFTIDVSMNDGRITTLSFQETDSLRSQSGAELTKRLAHRLSTQLAVEQ